MNKFAALALTAAVAVTAMAYTKPAEARVYVGVGVGVPGVALVAPSVYAYPPALGVYGPYYRGRPYFYRPGFIRYGYGFHGGYAYGRRWR
jgi:hypothetical protein